MMSRGTLIMSNQSFVLRVYYDHDTPLTLLPTGEYAVTQAVDIPRPVSYTHLTLPTICSV